MTAIELLSLIWNMWSTVTWWHCLILGIIFYVAYYYLSIPGKIPPGPKALPVLGYYPFLTKRPHEKFSKLGKKYGNIFSLYLGNQLIIILNDYDAIKEVFLYQGQQVFTDSKWLKGKLSPEAKVFTSASLKDLRLSNTDLEILLHKEVERFLKELKELEEKSTDIKNLLQKSVFNSICILLFGHQFQYNDKFQKLYESMEEFLKTTSTFSAGNIFPWMALILRKRRRTEKTFQTFKECIKDALQEKKQHHILGHRNDYIDIFLTEMKLKLNNSVDIQNSDLSSDEALANYIAQLLTTGSKATAAILMWTIVYMMEQPEIQKRIQKEIDNAIKNEDPLSWNDRMKTPLTEAVLHETQRLVSYMPVNSLHRTAVDINVLGFKIPKNSSIFANLWNINHDADFWKEPERFKPERFFMENGKIFKPEYYLPFSIGTWKCVGESFATMQLYIYFTKILQKFTLEAPEVPQNFAINEQFAPHTVITQAILRKEDEK